MAWRCSGVVAVVIVSEKVRRFTSGCVSPVGVVYSTAKPARDALSEGSMSKARRAERSPANALKARPSFAVCFSIAEWEPSGRPSYREKLNSATSLRRA